MRNIFLLLILTLSLVVVTLADQSEIDRMTQEIADVTMSPFCPGRTISACPSPAAKDLRDQIRNWLNQGYSKTAVTNQLRTLYGDDVLGTPEVEGFDLVAWASPILFLLIGLCLIFGLLYTLRAKPSASSEIGDNDALTAELEKEIKRRLEN